MHVGYFESIGYLRYVSTGISVLTSHAFIQALLLAPIMLRGLNSL
jgi:hypothetical protein